MFNPFRNKPPAAPTLIPDTENTADLLDAIADARDVRLTATQSAQLIAAAELLRAGQEIFDRNNLLVDKCRNMLVGWRDTMGSMERPIADDLIAEIDDWVEGEPAPNEGQEALTQWFRMSHASFCVLSRVLMGDMPDRWQMKMAHLLTEVDEAFPNLPEAAHTLTIRSIGPDGRMRKIPDALKDYRHPDRQALAVWRRGPIHDMTQFKAAVRDVLVEMHHPVVVTPSEIQKAVDDYVFSLGVQFGDPDFDWTWAGAETLAADIIEGARG